jgi:DNA mismatch repair protein MutS2
MVFPSEFEQKLGFDQIRHRLKNYCLSPLGIGRVDQMNFSFDFEIILTQLKQNLEFKNILEKDEEFPSTHYFDPTEYFKTAAIEGAFLEQEAFYEILRSLQTIVACKKIS